MNFLAKAEVAAAAAIALPPPTTNTLGQDSIFCSFFELGKSQCFGPTILKSKMSEEKTVFGAKIKIYFYG